MKNKIFTIIIVVVVIGAISAMVYAGLVLNKKNDSLDSHLISLDYKKFEEKINNKDSFILVITRTDCSHCQEYKPLLKQILLEYDITAYELDEEKLSEEEENKLKSIINVSGTPTTVFITDGEEKQTSSRLIGSGTRSKIVSRFKAMGYIKE